MRMRSPSYIWKLDELETLWFHSKWKKCSHSLYVFSQYFSKSLCSRQDIEESRRKRVKKYFLRKVSFPASEKFERHIGCSEWDFVRPSRNYFQLLSSLNEVFSIHNTRSTWYVSEASQVCWLPHHVRYEPNMQVNQKMKCMLPRYESTTTTSTNT